MDLQELQAELTDYLNDSTLLAEAKLQRRAEALDFLTFFQDVLRAERRRTPVIQALHQQGDAGRRQMDVISDDYLRRVKEITRR